LADQIAALNTILSNIPNGTTLTVRNFNKLKKEERGFARYIFLAVLDHLIKAVASRKVCP